MKAELKVNGKRRAAVQLLPTDGGSAR